jgi:hypothetical protein
MNSQQILKALNSELHTLDARRTQLQTAIQALGGGARLGRPPGKVKGKPHFSAKARASIAKAQRARWAKIKAAQKN